MLIATAFVHLLPTAFVSLTDPCLPPFWNRGYPAMAGLIAMTSVLIVVGIEMFFATRGAGHMHGSEYDTLGPEDAEGMPLSAHRLQGLGSPAFRGKDNMRPFRQWKIGDGQGGALSPGITYDDDDDDIPHTGRTLAPPTGPVLPNGLPKFTDDETTESDLEFDEMNIVADEAGLLSAEQGRTRTQSRRDDPPRIQLSNGLGEESPERHGSPAHLSEVQEQRKLLLQCLLLEAGILFHSVFIGMALSVATGTSFIVLLVAISFHRNRCCRFSLSQSLTDSLAETFEGLALGSRIAAITSLPPTSPKPWLMALAYGTTTPLGQAIGLLVHKLYDPASQTGLLTVGVMNAISSGLLLFAGLVELLAEDFLSDKSYEMLRGRPRIEACASVVGGAFLMALVGAWA